MRDDLKMFHSGKVCFCIVVLFDESSLLLVCFYCFNSLLNVCLGLFVYLFIFVCLWLICLFCFAFVCNYFYVYICFFVGLSLYLVFSLLFVCF